MLKLHRAIKLMFCLVVITSLLACSSTRTQRATGEFVDDSVITTKVKAAIFEEPTLKTMQIEVKTFKGEVQLSGFVDSAKSVTRAGEVARSVKGVTKVNNDLIVK
ncbi:MAG: BON domain-containing protein [Desulfuromonadales bacterium]